MPCIILADVLVRMRKWILRYLLCVVITSSLGSSYDIRKPRGFSCLFAIDSSKTSGQSLKWDDPRPRLVSTDAGLWGREARELLQERGLLLAVDDILTEPRTQVTVGQWLPFGGWLFLSHHNCRTVTAFRRVTPPLRSSTCLGESPGTSYFSKNCLSFSFVETDRTAILNLARCNFPSNILWMCFYTVECHVF